MRTLTIDVVSDVMCPWCFIGARRLDEALAAMPDVTATVRHVPFLLDPATPEGGADLRERLRAKYRMDPDRMFGQVESAAQSAGIPLDFAKVRRSYPTAAAHTLLRHAEARGTQRGLLRALYEAYFLGGEDVGSPEHLADIAAAHGFTRDEALRLNQGTVIVSFVITAEGAVREVSLRRRSGVDRFDANVLAAVRRAVLPPIPTALGVSRLNIRAPFEFRNPLVR